MSDNEQADRPSWNGTSVLVLRTLGCETDCRFWNALSEAAGASGRVFLCGFVRLGELRAVEIANPRLSAFGGQETG